MDGALVELRKVGHNGPIQFGHGLGRIPKGVIIASADAGCYRANILHATRSTLKLSLTPEWELIDHIEIQSTTDVFDFDTVYGDLDFEYKIEGFWKCAGTSASNLALRVNGSTSGLSNDGSARVGYTGSATSSQMLVAYKTSGASTAELYFETTFFATSGENPLGRSLVAETDGTGGSNTEIQMIAMKADNSSTVIRQLGLDGAAGTLIGDGSWFRLYRRPPAKGRNINLWIF